MIVQFGVADEKSAEGSPSSPEGQDAKDRHRVQKDKYIKDCHQVQKDKDAKDHHGVQKDKFVKDCRRVQKDKEYKDRCQVQKDKYVKDCHRVLDDRNVKDCHLEKILWEGDTSWCWNVCKVLVSPFIFDKLSSMCHNTW